MGLDQYLTKRKFFWSDEEKPKAVIQLEKQFKWKINEVELEAIYWRKSNQIHKWFVMNVQEGEDDCGNYELNKEKLEELLAVVTKVIDSIELIDWEKYMSKKFNDWKLIEVERTQKIVKDSSVAEELLPNWGWFFFGSTDYDEWYYNDLVNTKKDIEGTLADHIEWMYYSYHSSW